MQYLYIGYGTYSPNTRWENPKTNIKSQICFNTFTLLIPCPTFVMLYHQQTQPIKILELFIPWPVRYTITVVPIQHLFQTLYNDDFSWDPNIQPIWWWISQDSNIETYAFHMLMLSVKRVVDSTLNLHMLLLGCHCLDSALVDRAKRREERRRGKRREAVSKVAMILA